MCGAFIRAYMRATVCARCAEGAFRNPLGEVQRFFETRHAGKYRCARARLTIDVMLCYAQVPARARLRACAPALVTAALRVRQDLQPLLGAVVRPERLQGLVREVCATRW